MNSIKKPKRCAASQGRRPEVVPVRRWRPLTGSAGTRGSGRNSPHCRRQRRRQQQWASGSATSGSKSLAAADQSAGGGSDHAGGLAHRRHMRRRVSTQRAVQRPQRIRSPCHQPRRLLCEAPWSARPQPACDGYGAQAGRCSSVCSQALHTQHDAAQLPVNLLARRGAGQNPWSELPPRSPSTPAQTVSQARWMSSSTASFEIRAPAHGIKPFHA